MQASFEFSVFRTRMQRSVIFHLTNLYVHLLQIPSTVTKPVALHYYPHGPETQLYSVKMRRIEKYFK